MVGTLTDARTIRALLEGAERESAAMGEPDPGAEHVLISAALLPDGTAARALSALGIDADALRAAVQGVHSDALGGISVTVPVAPRTRGAMRSQDSVRELLKATASERSAQGSRRFFGAHVLLGVTDLEGGTALLALERLGVSPAQLRTAAEAALSSDPGSGG